jgi:thioesterase domain-containing protein
MDINCGTIEQYLHEHIPISKAMSVSVTSIDANGVILSAPLLPNINHRSTVFGGSISTIAILSAWTFVRVRLQVLEIPCRIIIKSNSINYLKPIEGSFHAHCLTPPQHDWDKFIEVVARRGKGRICLNVEVNDGKKILAAKFQGEYVALLHS